MTAGPVYISRVVNIGKLKMGGQNEVRIQSMTNTPAMDTGRTYRQVMELFEAGCEMVRLAARNIREAEQIGVIRAMLEKNGIYMPLAADIHFNPKVAERAAAIAHKIRINPGNYLDRQYFLSKDSGGKSRDTDPGMIREEIRRLTKISREHNTVIRIGVNHGSLSERVLMQYGNTAEGMVFSAMEFLSLCREEGFNELVVSMKSSHIPTMVRATLGIVDSMMKEGMDYPVHLGVTEAGAGEDGRIRSAAGIGPLLAIGIGDTIRVSLTEDPVKEIPVARKLVLMHRSGRMEEQKAGLLRPEKEIDKKQKKAIGLIGGDNPPVVVADTNVFVDPLRKADLILDNKGALKDLSGMKYPFMVFERPEDLERHLEGAKGNVFGELPVFTLYETDLTPICKMFDIIENKRPDIPVLIRLISRESDPETFRLKAASNISSLLLKGFNNGFWLENQSEGHRLYPEIVFSALQATGARITGTEYISCPGCGRTEFDLEKTLHTIKEHTQGLQNVKIAVMGCIVNGPGEMADADYGYVGAGKGKVTLYRAGKPIKKNIPQEEALDELLRIIRAHSLSGR